MQNRAVIAALAVTLMGLGGCGGGGDDDGPTEAEKSAQIEEALENEPITADDIAIDLRVKDEKCYGTLGCDVTLGVSPKFVGDAEYTGGSWEVTIELSGDINTGATIQTFVIDEDYTRDTPQDMQVETPEKGAGAKITAKVTDVRGD